MAHGVNTPVKGVQVPASHTYPDRLVGQAARAKLIDRHDGPLARGEASDRAIGQLPLLCTAK
ncbi:hypothetical protein OJ998_12780 [Solirubrobacter taibaiensis]|nr:hypothetical protein [Solirubrobacter taibaiensis]